MKASESQIGGDHYRTMRIQPHEFAHANGIGFHEASAIAYLCRWKSKGGLEDLKKARHFIDLLIELEERDEGVVSESHVEGVPSFNDLPEYIRLARGPSHVKEG